MQKKPRPTIKQLKCDCDALEEQVKLLVRTEVQLRRTKAELSRSNKKIEEYNKTLERKVEERTRELRISTEKLQHETAERARTEHELKMVEESLKRSERMEAIGLLAENVAHDLNNLLTCIIEYPRLIARKIPFDEQIHKHLDAISTCGEKAAGIVCDLSKLTKQATPGAEPVYMNELVKTTVNSPEFIRLRNEHPNITLRTMLHPNLLATKGSPVFICNAIINLVVNSIESMGTSGKLTISTDNAYVDAAKNCYERIEQGEYVTLSITDTGAGIPKKHLDRIFEPFYSRKFLKKKGTGLGMAIVWGIIKEHRGYIDIYSEEEVGTTITLYFPATRKKLTKKLLPPDYGDLRGNNETVLIIDDIDLQREICSQILAELGYCPIAVGSAEEALELLATKAADIVILDMVMEPGMNGFETYRKIIEQHPGQKAIIVSGYAEPELIQNAQRLGAGAFVKKPYTLERLGAAIRQELDKV